MQMVKSTGPTGSKDAAVSDDRPGLKIVHRRNGRRAAYWSAANVSRQAKDYPIKTVPLSHLPEEQWGAECRRLTGDLKLWLAGLMEAEAKLEFDGSIGSLLKHFQRHELSPYRNVKYNTQAKYDHTIKIVTGAVGERKLKKLSGLDFVRWEKEFQAPATKGGPRRVQRGHECMSMIRMAMRWGAVAGLPYANGLADILLKMEFEELPPREDMVTYDMAVALIAEAHEVGRPSIALAQALQFELTLRQKDVIGEWVPDMTGGGIRNTSINSLNNKRWDNGLTWSHIDQDMILKKRTTKRKVPAEFDLKLYPLVMAEIGKVPADRRVGPMIINEETGLPYTGTVFRDRWRELARAVGIPDTVQNRDSRAGGLTEATDAGADLEHARHHATHRHVATTARYSRPTLKKTSAVARLRVRARGEKPGKT
jgi:hypothetical protein